MITYPTTLDVFTNPTKNDNLDSLAVPHHLQHSNVNDAVEALEAKVGVNNSAVTASLDYKIRAIVPVGAILPWAKSLGLGAPALDETFVECNGQSLSDPGSPFHGETIPNLNGNNNFLRGNATSGGTGGSATHLHPYTGVTGDPDNGSVGVAAGGDYDVTLNPHGHAYSGDTDAESGLPPYYNVVWIMRVK